MNPLPLVAGELRRNPMGSAAVSTLIAVAVALGMASSAQGRALRTTLLHAEALQPHHAAIVANLHDLLRSVAFAFDGLLVTAVLLVIVAVLSARRQSVGALRALGAPPGFVFVAVWLQGALLIAAGVLPGIPLGFVLAKVMSACASAELGFEVDATIGVPELIPSAGLLLAGSLFAAAPSLPLLRVPAAHLLRFP